MPDPLAQVEALTFDLFGTVLDLGGSLRGPIDELLRSVGAATSAEAFWAQWRARQRIEQYQDTIVMLGHSGYLETARRALVYTLELNHIEMDAAAVDGLMAAWQQLSPFPEVSAALPRLHERYRLVALSNGNRPFLDHLVANRIGHPFDEVISVDVVGAFKPASGRLSSCRPDSRAGTAAVPDGLGQFLRRDGRPRLRFSGGLRQSSGAALRRFALSARRNGE